MTRPFCRPATDPWGKVMAPTPFEKDPLTGRLKPSIWAEPAESLALLTDAQKYRFLESLRKDKQFNAEVREALGLA